MTLRILLVEDRPTDAMMIDRELRRSGMEMEMIRVETETAFRTELERFRPDVILADYHLPSFDGLSALQIVRGSGSDVPFIFVSGSIGEEPAVETLRRGANDYVLKDRLARLPSAIESSLERARLAAATRRMQQQLDQADRVSSLGRIAATMAHEFNNVLMGIQPFADLLARSYADERAQTIAKQLKQSVSRGKAITQEILRFANDGAMVDPKPVNVAAWIETISGELQGLLGLIRLRIEFADEPLYVLGDLPSLQQVMTNLVINARDAMSDEGTVTIRMQRAERDQLLDLGAVPSGDDVLVSVTDEGAGISQDIVDRIFEPMFTTKRKGNGLGLALSNAVVTRHGGQMRVHSTVGAGTTFHIVLPRIAVPEQETVASPPARPAVSRLLLVDDDEDVAIAVSAALHFEDIATEIVRRGRDVIEAIERFDPDAIVLDIGLPDEDGFSVFQRVRARWPELPVVFASGHFVESSSTTGNAPRTSAVTKPYRIEDLLHILSRLIC